MKFILLPTAFFFLLLQVTGVLAQGQKEYDLLSPDKSIQLTVSVGNNLTFSLHVDGKAVMGASPISMTIDDNQVLGKNPKIEAVNRKTVNQQIEPVVWEKSRIIDWRIAFKPTLMIALRSSLKKRPLIFLTAVMFISRNKEVFFPTMKAITFTFH